ncbi:MAG: hypothetical protein ABI175_02190 [Polyangiales bacterium]
MPSRRAPSHVIAELAILAGALALVLVATTIPAVRHARADSPIDPMSAESVTPSVSAAPTTSTSTTAAPVSSAMSAWSGDGDTREGLDPFPSTGQYLDYGMSFHSEALLTSGRLCPKDAKENCVLGSGAGISFFGAYRSPRYSLGAAYEVTFHDSSNIYQRGVLQQLRGEWRIRPSGLVFGDSIVGFLGVGAGITAYGDNWAIDTYGPSAHGMIGTEIDLGVKVALVIAVAYRALYLKSFTDPSQQERPAGIAHMLGLSVGLELHDPL